MEKRDYYEVLEVEKTATVEEIKESKYRYIDELITRINEYNDI